MVKTIDRRQWIIALISVCVTAFCYPTATQIAVIHFGLSKLDVVTYSTVISVLVGLIVPLAKGWYDLRLIKARPLHFLLGGFCTKCIIVLGLASFVNPELNVAAGTVLLKSPLIPVALIVDCILGEPLNLMDFIAFLLAVAAIGVAVWGVCTDVRAQVATLTLLKSPWFWAIIGGYSLVYGIRMPVLRRYKDNTAYIGNEQLFTCSLALVFMFCLVPLIAYLFPGTAPGKIAAQMSQTLSAPSLKKLGAAFCVGLPFGLYASAVVWVMNSARNNSQAAIANKSLAGFSGASAALAVIAFCLWPKAGHLPLADFLRLVVTYVKQPHSDLPSLSSAPSGHDWASVGLFLSATVVAGLAANLRSAEKKRRIAAQRLNAAPASDPSIVSEGTQVQPA